jgi:hypothetical protein
MEEKIAKAKQHHVISTGTMEYRFEVLCKDRISRGIRRDRVVQETLIRANGSASCYCMKPKLLHLPCSHVIAACAESGLQPGVFVSPYFSMEAAVSTRRHEIYRIGIVGPLTMRLRCMFLIQPLRKCSSTIQIKPAQMH